MEHQMEPTHQSQGRASPRPHALDLYSIPVFLLEVVLLGGLATLAYLMHFDFKLAPYTTGFYCDEEQLRHELRPSEFTTRQLVGRETEMTVMALLVVTPITVILFCELLNSLFGPIKFRKIRTLCQCCKLHSITRRSIRFSGAFLLGLCITSISCDILSTISGTPRPYFAKECPQVYEKCQASSSTPNLPYASRIQAAETAGPQSLESANSSSILTPKALAQIGQDGPLRVSQAIVILPRKWVNLEGLKLEEVCGIEAAKAYESDPHHFNQLAKSWPSHSAAVFSFCCLFLAAYLSFVGTARPVRLITSCLVMSLLLLALVLNVQLVKDHYQHWQDTLAGSALAALVTTFVLFVYLNLFRDTHYYERQKLLGMPNNYLKTFTSSGRAASRSVSSEREDDYRMVDKTGPSTVIHHRQSEGSIQSEHNDNVPNGGSSSGFNNDLAMRYFQIPRANYRNSDEGRSSRGVARL